MFRILTILIFCTTLFAGELEVEGGITATGEIQSPTIEALLEQIAQLQEQIALLQAQVNASQGADNKLETRLYQTELLTNGEMINLNQDLNELIPETDFYIIRIVNIENPLCEFSSGWGFALESIEGLSQAYFQFGFNDEIEQSTETLFPSANIRVGQIEGECDEVIFNLAITSQF